MNVYSIVPSQRSQATVSVMNSKMIPRYAQTTAPISSAVVVCLDVDRAAGRLDPLRDEDDRERVRDRPDEERQIPPDVAAGEVDVALDDAAEPDQVVLEIHCHGSHQANTSLSSSSSSPPSSSNVRPVAAKNASSSVAAP